MTERTAVAQAPKTVEFPSAARRTLLTLVACGLGILPLKALLSDNRWIGQSWLAMTVVILPAALLRLRRAPSALDIWPGIILLIPWLTKVYVPDHARGGFIPTRATFSDVGDLMDNLHHTTTTEIAPIHSTVAVRLVLCALLGLLAALIDLIAVVGRRGALAGVPLLIVYTVAGAVPRHPVAWLWFCAAAIAFLMLMALDASDELREWGRRVTRVGAVRPTNGLGVSGQRIGFIAILIAVMLPLVAPDHPKNLIANAFHHRGGHGVGNFGAGAGAGDINPFAALKGQLERDIPVPLVDVSVNAPDKVQPFYLRSNVLDRYSDQGWTVSDHGNTEPIDGSSFGTEPVTGQAHTVIFTADIKITGLTGNAPLFNLPRGFDGLSGDTTWTPQDQLLLGSSIQPGDEFSEVVQQPAPTIAELQAAPPADDSAEMSRWLQLPDMPSYVTNLVAHVTRGAATPYDKARAISDWFADPANGFIYSLKTENGDSGSELVDFLQHRAGYCQQYAAAMGAMLRVAGVPARLVLGYMHTAPNAGGNFSIDTFDAHAWVEAFFPGAGWIPFDPTPTSGLTGGRASDLKWAPHVYTSGGANNEVTQKPTQIGKPTNGLSASGGPGSVGQSASSSSNLSGLWVGLVALVIVAMAVFPAAVRWLRRRRRLLAGRRGDPDPLWIELIDTATDLGYVWSLARTPRQVTDWLARDAGTATPALRALAVAVEERRYAPNPPPRDGAELTRNFDEITGRLRSIRSSRVRLQAIFWPASLGWGGRLRSVVRRGRHR